jgi:hypothetical protein
MSNPDDDEVAAGPEEPLEDSDDANRRLLAQLYGSDGPPDMEVFAGPLHWPDIPAVDLAAEFGGLCTWVKKLIERFPHLDHTIIPSCWWRHNGHVEALQALRDHERVSYADSSPGTAGVEWHRALTLVEARLREWTAWCGCANGHREPIAQLPRIEASEWEAHVRDQVEHRGRQEIEAALPPSQV